jgi:hypothetical protein
MLTRVIILQFLLLRFARCNRITNHTTPEGLTLSCQRRHTANSVSSITLSLFIIASTFLSPPFFIRDLGILLKWRRQVAFPFCAALTPRGSEECRQATPSAGSEKIPTGQLREGNLEQAGSASVGEHQDAQARS